MNYPRFILLDFDGVILESKRVKEDAFVEVFGQLPDDLRDRAFRHHRSTPGVPRREKIRDLAGIVYGRSPTDGEVTRLMTSLDELIQERLSRCPLVPGVKEFLRDAQNSTLHVISAAPEDEVRAVTAALDLFDCFAGVHGAPRTKAEILRELIDHHAVVPKESIFVGDRKSDKVAAQDASVAFVARSDESNQNEFPSHESKISDFRDLPQVVETFQKALKERNTHT